MSFTLPQYHEPDFQETRFQSAPEARFEPAPKDGVAPEGYHATTIYPEYFKVGGRWLLAEESRMDCVAALRDGKIAAVEFRNLKAGEPVAVGRTEDASEGIYVYPFGFAEEKGEAETFAFRQGRSRETAFSRDYDELYELLRHERDHGKVVWVMGPAFAFDHDARNAFSRLIAGGFVHAVLAGNALATHDLEAAYLNTALGQNIYTQESQPNGHYNHLDTINRVRLYGSIPAFLKAEQIENGILHTCERHGVPYILAGSIRDDGPLPPVLADVYAAQDAMRAEIRSATTVICAVGEGIDASLYDAAGVEHDRRGRLAATSTGVEGVWAAGDCRRGPATVVEAIADAAEVARAIAGVDFNKYADQNAQAGREDTCYERKGSLCRDKRNCTKTRCLGCGSVCEVCCDVCPNRANVAIKVPGLAKHQVVHVDGMCNECGNCAVFCPYQEGRPYKDKLTLFWSEEDMENSENEGFLAVDEDHFKVRVAGTVRTVSVDAVNTGLPEAVRLTIRAVRDNYSYLLKK